MHVDAHEMGGNALLLPAGRRSDLPRGDGGVGRAARTTLYGAAMQAEFDRQHIQYFNDKVFDFFAMVYGDTVPSRRVRQRRDDVREGELRPDRRTDLRALRHALGVALRGGALNREQILLDWHGSWVEALPREPPGGSSRTRSTTRATPSSCRCRTIRVRHYFLRADDPAKAAEVQSLVRRLQRMDVEVYRLTAPLSVPDFTPYGRPRARRPSCRPARTGSRWRRRRSTGSRRC